VPLAEYTQICTQMPTNVACSVTCMHGSWVSEGFSLAYLFIRRRENQHAAEHCQCFLPHESCAENMSSFMQSNTDWWISDINISTRSTISLSHCHGLRNRGVVLSTW